MLGCLFNKKNSRKDKGRKHRNNVNKRDVDDDEDV